MFSWLWLIVLGGGFWFFLMVFNNSWWPYMAFGGFSGFGRLMMAIGFLMVFGGF